MLPCDPRQIGQLRIVAAPYKFDVDFLYEFDADVARPWGVFQFADALEFSFRILEIFILVVLVSSRSAVILLIAH